ncbi:MAG TPA: glycosyltransferase family 1 protein [Candidatus Saccharimonadales bacterium]|nr:glycosyltransferase family 1 protein [Candidatus Saccharimonadales bacterium]
MKRVVIDARESGTSTGRYVDKLVEYLNKLKPDLEIIVLAKSHRLEALKKIAPDFQILKSDYKEFTFTEQLGFRRQLRKLRPDLVHFGMTQQPVRYRGPKVTTIHDLTTIRFDNPAKNRLVFKFKQGVYKWLIKKVSAQSAAIITPSQYVKQDVAQYTRVSPGKIFVTYEAADRISAAPKAVPRLSGQQFIMYVGRPLPHKNLERLIKAFELLKRAHPNLMLVLVGGMDKNYKKLEALVSHKRMAHSVVFTGFVTEGELRWLYENTAAYVFPSLSEGFGLPGLEAMAHNAPVISSNATCLPEIYGDAAHYFNPRNTRDIAAKIHEVLVQPRLRAGLISKGRARAAKYSWSVMSRQTLRIYKNVLGE